MAGLQTSVAVGFHANDGEITDMQGAVNILLARSAGIVWVTDYGADTTGATSSTTAVTAALAALPSNGGTLYFPGGTYKFNLSTIRGGIQIVGAGSGNVNTALGGTIFKPATVSSPILQIGDGATNTCRGIRLSDFIMVGDGSNATGDGLYIYGARDLTVSNVVATSFGRNCVRIQCNTTSSSGIHLVNCALSTNTGAALSIETSAASFTTDVTVTDSHLNAGSAANSHALLLDSTDVRLSGTYLDLHDGATGGSVKLLNTLGTPRIRATTSTFDQADGAAAISVDVSTWLAKANGVGSVISGSYTINGSVKYSDGTVDVSATREAAILQAWLANPYTFNSMHMPLTEAAATTDTVTLSRAGATPDTDAQVVVSHAALKVTGDSTTPLQLGTSALYKNTNSLLMFRKDASFPSAENNAQPLNWVAVTPSTASTTITIDASLGNVFYCTVTTNAVHTIANPSGSGVGVASHSQALLEIWIINTSGAPLGVFTWSGNYKFAAATAPNSTATPTTGNRFGIQFRQDAAGTLWYETWRSTTDVAN